MGQEDSMLMMQEQTVSSSPNAFFQDHYHGGVHGAKGSEVKNNGVPVGTGNVLATHNAAEQQSSIITPSTQMSPSMYRQGPDAYKSLPSGMVPARGPRTRFFDPLTLMYSAGYRERRFSVSFDALRAIVKQVPIIASIITTRVNQVAAFAQPYRENKQVGFQIRFKDDGHQPSDEEKEQIRRLEQMIMACGFGPNPYSPYPRDDFETFLRKFTTDSLTLDQACAEITPDTYGRPYEFRAVDAATIRLAATFEGFRGSGPNRLQREQFTDGFQERWKKVYGEEFGGMTSDQVFSIQLLHGRIENIFSYNDLAFCVRNPETNIWNNGYGTSELEKALNAVLGMLWGEIYNRAFFKQGSAPKGLINIKGDEISEAQMESFRRAWYAMIAGVENCLHGDTTIWTKEEGMVSLENYIEGTEEKEATIWTGKEWASGLVYRTKEQKQLCRLKLACGLEIKSSPDHKFRVLGGGDGLPVWKRLEDLQEGDYVLVNKQSPQNPDNIPLCNEKQVTPGLMEVLGWAVGDGYFSNRGMLCFYHHEKEREIRERHLSILKDFDPAARLKDIHITPEEQEKIKERYGFKSVASERLQIVLNNVNFARWLKEVGFQFSSEGKNIPSFVYTLPNELKFAFLRGLFSADGHIGDGRFVAITITNDSLRQEVKWLLSSVGIRTNLSEGKQKIVINGPLRHYEEKESILRIKDKDYFYENIGFLQDHKQPDDLVSPNEANKHSRVSPRTIYFFARKIQKKNKEANYELLTLRERLDLNAIIRGDDGCSHPRILRFLEKVNITPPNWLIEYHFSPIAEIETTNDFVDMFDVSINTDLHAFAANGIVISNSFRTPILQAEQMEYIDLQHTNREMEFQSWLEYLIRQVCASYLIDPSEVGFDLTSGGGSGGAPVFESKHEWKIKHSRDKGLRPLLRFISKQITKYIVDPLDSRLYFDFVGLDELSERERVELLNMKMSAFMTLNEGRASEGLPPRPDGNVILNPAWIQARTLLEEEGQMLPDPSEEQMAYMTAGENEIPGYGQAKPVPLYMQTNPDRNKIPPLGGVPDPNDPNQM